MALLERKNSILLFFLLILYFLPILVHGGNFDSLVNVIHNSQITIEKKISITDNIRSLPPTEEIKILNLLLDKARREKKDHIYCKLYSLIANYYIEEENINKGSIYIDSASIFIDKVKSPLIIGDYYRTLGNFYNLKIDAENAHKYYYLAIDNYEKAGNKEKDVLSLFHNIAFSYIQRKEYDKLKILITHIQPISIKINDSSSYILFYRIMSYYYGGIYREDENVKTYLDSAIIYDKKAIDLFEAQKNKELYSNEIAYNYINLANNYLQKDSIDAEQIEELSNKALLLANKQDTAMLVNGLFIKSKALLRGNKKTEAKATFLDLIKLMDAWSISENLSMYSYVYGTLADISSSEGKYEEAFFYEQKKSEYKDKIYDKSKYEVISELQTKYETEKKEQQIAEHQRTIVWILAIGALVILISLLIISWQRLNKKNMKKQLKIVRLEKLDAENKMLQKEEALTRTNLEKYELLLDNYFKKQELSIELEELRGEYESLKKEHDERQKETIESIHLQQDEIVLNVRNLISSGLKSFPDDLNWYLYKLGRIEDNSVFLLKQKDLTDTDVQYCICFGIGMKTKHIMQCYSIATQTVRSIRSRVRTNLGLEKDDNLDVYLIDLLQHR